MVYSADTTHKEARITEDFGYLIVHPGELSPHAFALIYDKHHVGISIEKGVIAPKDCSHLFDGFYDLEVIEGLEYLDTSQVEDMSYMFSNCTSLHNVDVSDWDTSQVRDMNHMFSGCGVSEINMSSWDVGNVVDMSYMFMFCEFLKKVDMCGLNSGKVMNMENMFSLCSELESFDAAGIDIGNVINLKSMFYRCSNLSNFTFPVGDIKPIADAYGLFEASRFDGMLVAPQVAQYDEIEKLKAENAKLRREIRELKEGLGEQYGALDVEREVPMTASFILSEECLSHNKGERFIQLPKGSLLDGVDVSGCAVCGISIDQVDHVVGDYYSVSVKVQNEELSPPFIVDEMTHRIRQIGLEELSQIVDSSRVNELVDLCKNTDRSFDPSRYAKPISEAPKTIESVMKR